MPYLAKNQKTDSFKQNDEENVPFKAKNDEENVPFNEENVPFTKITPLFCVV